MKIIDVEQGSDEWLSLRKGVLTASNFSKIITSKGEPSKSANDYAYELAAQTLMQDVEETYKSPEMMRGNELEPLAREAYEQWSFNSVKECGFMLSNCEKFGYSPDGLVGDDGLIEIKCPKAKNHLKYLKGGKCPTEYYAQVQGGLFVSKRKWCDFISYHPDFYDEHQLFVFRVLPDLDFISKLAERIAQFTSKVYQLNLIK